MDSSQLQELIQADLDGELSASERAELARLLLQDSEARRLHDELRRTHQLLRDIAAIEPPPDLRATILSGLGLSVRLGDPGGRRYGLPLYRMAAAILGGLLIVGISFLLFEGNAPGTDLQGSLGRARDTETTALIAPQNRLSLRAEGVEVNASLRRDGQGLRLELHLSTTIPCEVIAKIDPATMTFTGNPSDAQLTAASDQVMVRLATGSQDFVLDFSGAAPIELQLRSGGRLLGQGRLSIGDR